LVADIEARTLKFLRHEIEIDEKTRWLITILKVWQKAEEQ
jgi:hypothetical protein